MATLTRSLARQYVIQGGKTCDAEGKGIQDIDEDAFVDFKPLNQMYK